LSNLFYNKMSDLILFGMQGSGKGTQARILADNFNLTIFETGAALRQIAAENSELGKKVKAITEAGHLVPNEIVMDIIEDFLKKISPIQRVLFDGIPRKEEQRQTFEATLSRSNRQTFAIYLKISREEAFKRLGGRKTCSQCKEIYGLAYTEKKCGKCGAELAIRSDDQNNQSIINRIDVFEKETMPVIEKYREQGRLLEVDGMPKTEKVTAELLRVVGEQ